MFPNGIVPNLNAHTVPEEDKHRFPNISKPITMGSYSVSPSGHFERNNSGMRYIVLPPPHKFPLNLREIPAPIIPHDPEPEETIDHLLMYIESTRYTFLKPSQMCVQVNADVVCTAKVLELIMSAPYEHKRGWTLAATRYRNTTYISCVEQAQLESFHHDNLRRILHATWLHSLRKMCLFGGYTTGILTQKKPTYMLPFLADNAMGHPNQNEATEGSNRLNAVLSFELNGMHILFDSPVLAELAPHAFDGKQHVWAELQLRQDNMNRTEWATFNRIDGIKWWIKGLLLGIETFHVGLRDENAVVRSIKKVSMRDLYSDSETGWSPFVCANFLGRFMGAITQIMAQVDCPNTVYTFEFDATHGNVEYTGFEGRNEHTFVADWFRQMLDEHFEDL
ncbi:hypothetical protein KR018_008605, partial [Drosophila ironensis]